MNVIKLAIASHDLVTNDPTVRHRSLTIVQLACLAILHTKGKATNADLEEELKIPYATVRDILLSLSIDSRNKYPGLGMITFKKVKSDFPPHQVYEYFLNSKGKKFMRKVAKYYD